MEPDRGLSRVFGVRDEQTLQVAEFYSAACPRLIGYLTVLTGSRADAEEIAQDTFVQALRHWQRIRRYDDPTAWLLRVSTRLVISRGRRGQVARRGVARIGARLEESVDVSPDSRLDLDVALTSLPVEHRAVLLLHHVHDLSIAEVSRMLGIPEGTVKSRLARARAALQPLLDDPRSTS